MLRQWLGSKLCISSTGCIWMGCSGKIAPTIRTVVSASIVLSDLRFNLPITTLKLRPQGSLLTSSRNESVIFCLADSVHFRTRIYKLHILLDFGEYILICVAHCWFFEQILFSFPLFAPFQLDFFRFSRSLCPLDLLGPVFLLLLHFSGVLLTRCFLRLDLILLVFSFSYFASLFQQLITRC